MDQQLRSTRDDHEELILGICNQIECKADSKIFCVKCLTTIHSDCKDPYYKEDFIQKLRALKYIHKAYAISLTDTMETLVNSMKTLECYIEKVSKTYDQSERVDQIEKILSNQDRLTANNWKEGHELLSFLDKDVQKLQHQLNKIIQQIDEIIPKLPNKLITSDWNTITLTNPRIIQAKHLVQTIALSPDGKFIASAGFNDLSIKIWDPAIGDQVGNSLNGHTSWIRSINYSNCGKFILSGGLDRSIRQWNTQTQQQVGNPMLGHEDSVTQVQYTQDQKDIVSCSQDKTIRFWNAHYQTELAFQGTKHENAIFCMSVSNYNIAYGDSAGLLTIWNYRNNHKQSLQGHNGVIHSVQYSKDGKLIVTGSEDKTIIIWDAISRQYIRSCFGNTSRVTSVSFSPDMRFIISGEQNQTVRIWDQITGKQIDRDYTHHKKSVTSTWFSLDGQHIITGGLDQQIRIMLAPYQIGSKGQEKCNVF